MADFPSSWTRLALVSVAPVGGASIDFVSSTETIDIDQGDKPVEYVATLSGGRVEKLGPEEVTTITVELYPTSIDTVVGSDKAFGMEQLFNTTDTNWDSTEPLESDVSRNREKYGLAIMWTDEASVTAGNGAVSIGSTARRLIVLNARLTSSKVSFTDGLLKCTAKFIVAPYTKDGNPNIKWQSSDGTTTLSLASLGVTSLGQLWS